MHLAWKTTMVLAVAALMTGPATAEWYAHGSFEPDTTYDQAAMFVDPPNATESRVYFYALPATSYSDLSRPVNPNVGALRTQVEPLAVEFHNAYLGVWQDCNGDGYIGMAEGALREYSAELLVSEAVCPPETGAAGAWVPGAYNYNGWVSEFIPILPSNLNAADRRVYRDDDARVWGDFHRPDEKPFHRSCTLRPFARGTLADSGGFANYIDCRVDVLGNFNTVVDMIGDPAGLRFSNEDDAHSGTLGGIRFGGPESNDHAAVRTVDCDAGPALRVHSGETANQTPLGPSVPATAQNRSAEVPTVSPSLGPGADPTHFSLAGQVNQTAEEWADDCDTSNDFGHDLYEPVSGVLFETDFNGVNPDNKLEADWNFNISASPGQARGALPFSLLAPLRWNGASGPAGDAGIGNNGMRWTSDSTWASKTGPRSVRLDLENGGIAIAPAYWLTFYAKVGADTTARGFAFPPGGGVYGSWHCGENESGIHNGWNCNEDLWYQNPDGSFPSDPQGWLAKVGWQYRFRDVDCYDGRIGDTGLAVQPAFYGSEPCVPAS